MPVGDLNGAAGANGVGRDIDQIKADLLSPKHLANFKNTKAAEDLPALGRHYCIECATWFDSDHTLLAHRRGKPHKRRFVPALMLSSPNPAASLTFLTVSMAESSSCARSRRIKRTPRHLCVPG